MKEQLKQVVIGVAGQLAYSETFKISDSEKEEMLNPENWEFKGANSSLIILNEMKYLFEYNKFFIQIQLTVINNVITRIDTITNPNNKITINVK